MHIYRGGGGVSIIKSLITVGSTVILIVSLYPITTAKSLLKPGLVAVETALRPIPDEVREAYLRLQVWVD